MSRDANCDGQVNATDTTAFNLALSDPAAYEQQYPTCDILNCDMNSDGLVNEDDRQGFIDMLSAGGNGAIYLIYTWDAENGLIKVEPGGTPGNMAKKAEYTYDYRGRRIQKQVWSRAGGAAALFTSGLRLRRGRCARL